MLVLTPPRSDHSPTSSPMDSDASSPGSPLFDHMEGKQISSYALHLLKINAWL